MCLEYISEYSKCVVAYIISGSPVPRLSSPRFYLAAVEKNSLGKQSLGTRLISCRHADSLPSIILNSFPAPSIVFFYSPLNASVIIA